MDNPLAEKSLKNGSKSLTSSIKLINKNYRKRKKKMNCLNKIPIRIKKIKNKSIRKILRKKNKKLEFIALLV